MTRPLQVIEKVREVKQSLADCLFCLACQSPLAKVDILRLIGHLRGDTSVTAAGTMEDVSIALLMAALYCLDSQALEEDDSQGEGHSMCTCIHTYIDTHTHSQTETHICIMICNIRVVSPPSANRTPPPI